MRTSFTRLARGGISRQFCASAKAVDRSALLKEKARDRVKKVPSMSQFLKESSTERIQVAGDSQAELQQQPSAIPVSEILKNKKYFIETYGCQMNEADTEIIRAVLEANGMTEAIQQSETDVILLNTCAIRENAESKVFHRLNEIRAERNKSRRDFLIGVLGCMAERLKVDLIEKNKAVDIVVGPDAYRDLPRLIADLMVRLYSSIVCR